MFFFAFADPTAAFSASDVAATTPEIWGDYILEANFPKAVLANFFTDLSYLAEEEGDTIHVPDIYTNTFSASTQSTQGNGVVDQSPAQVDVTLSINTHSYVAWLFGDKTIKQLAMKEKLNEAYAREAKNVLMQALEDALAALWSSLSTNVIGDTTTVLSDAEIRDAINALDTLNYDLTETAFFFHPFVYWTQLGGIAKYYSQYSSNFNFIRTGNFGPGDASRGLRGVLYDQPCYVTSRIVSGLQTYRNLFAHKSAFGYARQTPGVGGGMGFSANGIRVQADYLLQNLGMLTVVDMMYGVAVLREAAGVVVNANSTAKTS
jgi:hypothetical protein